MLYFVECLELFSLALKLKWYQLWLSFDLTFHSGSLWFSEQVGMEQAASWGFPT